MWCWARRPAPQTATRYPQNKQRTGEAALGEVGEGRQHLEPQAQRELTRPHRQQHSKDSENQTSGPPPTKGRQNLSVEAKTGGCLGKTVKTVLT